MGFTYLSRSKSYLAHNVGHILCFANGANYQRLPDDNVQVDMGKIEIDLSFL